MATKLDELFERMKATSPPPGEEGEVSRALSPRSSTRLDDVLSRLTPASPAPEPTADEGRCAPPPAIPLDSENAVDPKEFAALREEVAELRKYCTFVFGRARRAGEKRRNACAHFENDLCMAIEPPSTDMGHPAIERLARTTRGRLLFRPSGLFCHSCEKFKARNLMGLADPGIQSF